MALQRCGDHTGRAKRLRSMVAKNKRRVGGEDEMRVFASVAASFVLGLAMGGEVKAQKVTIETEYLSTAEATIEAPLSVGSRLVVNVPPGGSVKGPKLNGTFVAPTGDWLIPMPDGSLRLDVRAMIKTDDGELIMATYSGAIVPSKEVMERFNKGEVITSKDEYFIVAPQFTTASKKYEWLNQVQAIGKMVTVQQGKIVYDWFLVR
jgi:hypothetical protein